MTQLKVIRETMTEFLKQHGVHARTAWPNDTVKIESQPLVLVSLKKVQTDPSGFQNYLGEQFDRTTQTWQELYGQKTKVCFALDLYSPKTSGETGCQETLDRLAEVLQQTCTAGFTITQFSCGKTSYDRSCGMFHSCVEALCQVFLCAVTDESGSFLSFEVRGGMTN